MIDWLDSLSMEILLPNIDIYQIKYKYYKSRHSLSIPGFKILTLRGFLRQT